MYFNYKKYFSQVLLAVVDSNAMFLYVNFGAQGSFNDASVLRNTNFFKLMQQQKLNFPDPKPINENGPNIPFFIIGDGGFGLNQHIMKPFGGRYMKI